MPSIWKTSAELRSKLPPLNTDEFWWIGIPVGIAVFAYWMEGPPWIEPVFRVAEAVGLIFVGHRLTAMSPPAAFAFNYFETFVKPLQTALKCKDLDFLVSSSPQTVKKNEAAIDIVVPSKLSDETEFDSSLIIAAKQKQDPTYSSSACQPGKVKLDFRPDRAYDVYVDSTTTPSRPAIIDVPSALGAVRAFARSPSSRLRWSRPLWHRSDSATDNPKVFERALEEFHDQLNYRIQSQTDGSEDAVPIKILRT